jgi:DNA-binding MarR family transcriptional regulator
MVKPSEINPQLFAEMANSCACLRFRKASRSVTQLYDQFLAPSGLRANQLVVLLTAYTFNSSNLRKLADELAMDRSTLTRNLKPLISQRLLRTVPGEGRGRSRTVEVTTRGKRKLMSAAPYWQQAQESMCHRMGRDRIRRMVQDLMTVTKNIRKTDGPQR